MILIKNSIILAHLSFPSHFSLIFFHCSISCQVFILTFESIFTLVYHCSFIYIYIYKFYFYFYFFGLVFRFPSLSLDCFNIWFQWLLPRVVLYSIPQKQMRSSNPDFMGDPRIRRKKSCC